MDALCDGAQSPSGVSPADAVAREEGHCRGKARETLQLFLSGAAESQEAPKVKRPERFK